MPLTTCAQVISFVKTLENDSARLYQELAKKYAKDEALFLSLAKENQKNVVNIERAYYGVITDAIEGCFAFNVEPDAYKLNTGIPAKASYAKALQQAIDIEEKILKFYADAGEQSKSLMADVPRAFAQVARKRRERIPKLKSLLESD